MCGIVGIFSRGAPILEERLQRATHSLFHRGPDGRRHWISANRRVGLGHARLSIIDLATGTQPIASEDGRSQIVVNGEFYGYEAIQRHLERSGHRLVIVTKIGARRGTDGSWIPAFSPTELTEAVHDNLRNLGVDVLDVVNLRSMHGTHEPADGSIEQPLSVLADLQRKGLVRHIPPH